MYLGIFDVWSQPNLHLRQYVLTIFQMTYWKWDLMIISFLPKRVNELGFFRFPRVDTDNDCQLIIYSVVPYVCTLHCTFLSMHITRCTGYNFFIPLKFLVEMLRLSNLSLQGAKSSFQCCIFEKWLTRNTFSSSYLFNSYPALDFEEISMYLRLAWLNCYHLVIYMKRCYFIQLYSSKKNKHTLVLQYLCQESAAQNWESAFRVPYFAS